MWVLKLFKLITKQQNLLPQKYLITKLRRIRKIDEIIIHNKTHKFSIKSKRWTWPQKSSTEEQSSWASRDPFPRSSPSICASPRVGRKPRVDASPRRQESESPKYRTPPSTPFQPGFYRKPAEDEPRSNPFPLPSPSPRRPRQPRTRPRDEGSDSEDEVWVILTRSLLRS